jgi:hypothetical protein
MRQVMWATILIVKVVKFPVVAVTVQERHMETVNLVFDKELPV